MSYTRSRSLLAAGNLGLWLLISTLGLVLGWGTWLDQIAGQWHPSVAVLTAVALYTLINFPFDLFGGYVLPSRFGRSNDTFGVWLQKWVRGVLVHAVYLFLNATLMVLMTQWLGIWGAVGWVSLQMILLTGFQIWIAQAISGFKTQPTSDRGRPVIYVKNEDRAFTGGVSGVPGKETIVLPQYWVDRFSDNIHKVLLARRHGAINTGSHGKGIIGAFAWNLVLFTLAAFLSTSGVETVAGWVETIWYFSIFSLLTLMGLLPFMSRRSVLQLDRWVYYKGADADALRESFSLTQQLQNSTSDGGSTTLLQTIPSPEARRNHMATQKDIKGAYNISALAVYLSWAGVNLLARSGGAVIGRPELWVFQPGD